MKKSRALCTIRVWEVDDPGRLEKARKVVQNLKGVVKVQANYILHLLTVESDPEKITLDEIRNSVKKIGRK
ncbi:MAG TPA: heavy-metal-associated domain-containing protein [Candidatus Bathyarchaeia archaeon]|nr:heavy-metal-associated domain-containing protein [Candidatus Bathyarchaeia archaeon]